MRKRMKSCWIYCPRCSARVKLYIDGHTSRHLSFEEGLCRWRADDAFYKDFVQSQYPQARVRSGRRFQLYVYRNSRIPRYRAKTEAACWKAAAHELLYGDNNLDSNDTAIIG